MDFNTLKNTLAVKNEAAKKRREEKSRVNFTNSFSRTDCEIEVEILAAIKAGTDEFYALATAVKLTDDSLASRIERLQFENKIEIKKVETDWWTFRLFPGESFEWRKAATTEKIYRHIIHPNVAERKKLHTMQTHRYLLKNER